MRAQSAKIFLNYRRSVTSRHTASTIAERLRLHFGADNVFLDLHSIGAGLVFMSELEKAINKCNVFLALIGPNWVDVRGPKGRRLDDPEDHVGMEIRMALQRRIIIVPVLLEGGVIPDVDVLPEALHPLVDLQAVTLTTDSLGFSSLIEGIENVLGLDRTDATPWEARRISIGRGSWEWWVRLTTSSHYVRLTHDVRDRNRLYVDGKLLDESKGNMIRFEFELEDGKGPPRSALIESAGMKGLSGTQAFFKGLVEGATWGAYTPVGAISVSVSGRTLYYG